MDVKSAFLNRELENEIYMKILSGVDAKEGQVSLHKPLYGLKQASREWYLKPRGKLEGLQRKRCRCSRHVTCLLMQAVKRIFAISVEPAITSLNSKVTTQLPYHSRHLSILTGQEIGWTGSPSLVLLLCWTQGQYLGDQRSRRQFLCPRWKPNLWLLRQLSGACGYRGSNGWYHDKIVEARKVCVVLRNDWSTFILDKGGCPKVKQFVSKLSCCSSYFYWLSNLHLIYT